MIKLINPPKMWDDNHEVKDKLVELFTSAKIEDLSFKNNEKTIGNLKLSFENNELAEQLVKKWLFDMQHSINIKNQSEILEDISGTFEITEYKNNIDNIDSCLIKAFFYSESDDGICKLKIISNTNLKLHVRQDGLDNHDLW